VVLPFLLIDSYGPPPTSTSYLATVSTMESTPTWFQLAQAVSRGRLGRGGEAKLLPVKATPERSLTTASSGSSQPSSAATIHIQLQHAQVRIEGSADAMLLRVLLECLQR
jgi:hypothetical protein